MRNLLLIVTFVFCQSLFAETLRLHANRIGLSSRSLKSLAPSNKYNPSPVKTETEKRKEALEELEKKLDSLEEGPIRESARAMRTHLYNQLETYFQAQVEEELFDGHEKFISLAFSLNNFIDNYVEKVNTEDNVDLDQGLVWIKFDIGLNEDDLIGNCLYQAQVKSSSLNTILTCKDLDEESVLFQKTGRFAYGE